MHFTTPLIALLSVTGLATAYYGPSYDNLNLYGRGIDDYEDHSLYARSYDNEETLHAREVEALLDDYLVARGNLISKLTDKDKDKPDYMKDLDKWDKDKERKKKQKDLDKYLRDQQKKNDKKDKNRRSLDMWEDFEFDY